MNSCNCAAQNAIGQGECFGFFGFKWNGITCTQVTGCSCVGSDCGKLFADGNTCLKAHDTCPQLLD